MFLAKNQKFVQDNTPIQKENNITKDYKAALKKVSQDL